MNLAATLPCAPAAATEPARGSVMQIDRLGLSYHGRWAFRDVCLEIPAHTVTALIGPSGCGKTSFLSCLNRLTDLIPGCATEGSVRLNGNDIHAKGTDVVALRRRVGMIFQKPNPFPLSIRRNLELPLLEIGMRRRDDIDAVVERVLSEVGLWDEVRDRLDAPAQALSGGQQQRLCIARALTLQPELLLMDEPCSALDPIASGVVEDLITELKQHYSVLIVTHNLAQARRISDRCGVFWVRGGTGGLVECGETGCIFECPSDPLTAAYVQGRRG
jgi:phosphate transport system ATP-binding protein